MIDFHFLIIIESLRPIWQLMIVEILFLNGSDGLNRMSELALHPNSPRIEFSILLDSYAVSQTIAHGNPVGRDVLRNTFLFLHNSIQLILVEVL